MPRKKHLKILGFNYEVKVVEPNEMNEGINGICDDVNLNILIKRNKIMVSTLIHEIIEALNTNLDFGFEHRVILQLESGVYQVLVDNKLLNTDTIKNLLRKD